VARTDVAAAINAEQTLDVTYAPDPRGWRQFAALAGAHNRTLTGARAVIDTSSTNSGGWHRPLQRLRGLAPLILGAARPVTPETSVIGDERSDVGANAAERILAARWKREAGGPSW
jgi:hypothetical protein